MIRSLAGMFNNWGLCLVWIRTSDILFKDCDYPHAEQEMQTAQIQWK